MVHKTAVAKKLPSQSCTQQFQQGFVFQDVSNKSWSITK